MTDKRERETERSQGRGVQDLRKTGKRRGRADEEREDGVKSACNTRTRLREDAIKRVTFVKRKDNTPHISMLQY